MAAIEPPRTAYTAGTPTVSEGTALPMVYDIEFIRAVDNKAEELALDIIQLVADGIAGIIEQAEQLYRKLDTLPRPDGFRIRDDVGVIVHEFHEPQPALRLR